MKWFKTAEEKAAEKAQWHAEEMQDERSYIADRTGVDVRNLREIYKDDEESLSATFNSLSDTRLKWGFLVAGTAIFGLVAAIGAVDTAITHRVADIPFISTLLTGLCTWGVHAMSGKMHRIEDGVKDKAAKLSATAPSAPAPQAGPT
jgi:ribose/xylose/arabinose/galactoside ABC-type transport system permease subunit